MTIDRRFLSGMLHVRSGDAAEWAAAHARSVMFPKNAKREMEPDSGSQDMTKNVFIVEGLPGVGKSYFCEILQQEIRDRTGDTQILFFEERDTDHPFHCSEEDIGGDIWSIDYSDCFKIVESKCHEFFAGTYRADEIYVFDCGPLQRPLFYSMIMSNFSEEATLSHLLKLHRSYENLPFQVFYLESEDSMRDFESIYRSRGSDYRDHIDKAWNNSGYGTKQKLTGLEGAMRVLAYFKELKERFIHRLDLSPAIIDNTAKDPDILRNRTGKMLGTT